MISVIIATQNDEMALAYALAALVPAAAEGIVREVIVADSGSEDGTVEVADAAGCRILRGSGKRGADLANAACSARSDWLMFLSPDAMLEPGWQREVHDFIDRVMMSGDDRLRAASFRHARASFGWKGRFAELAAAIRLHLFAAPYPQEGLLIPARLYRQLGGHRPLPAMAEIDLARRIGRGRLSFLRSRAIIRDGGAKSDGVGRALKNTACLSLFLLHVPANLIGRLAA